MNTPEPYAETDAKRINPDTQRKQTSAKKTLGSGSVTPDRSQPISESVPDRPQPIAFREPRNAVSPEPVAWAAVGRTGRVEFGSDLKAEAEEYAEAGIPQLRVVPLYAAPPQPAIADAESLARLFHEEYERRSAEFDYKTRPDTRQFDPSSPNGRLMVAVCRAVMGRLSPQDRVVRLPSGYGVLEVPDAMDAAGVRWEVGDG